MCVHPSVHVAFLLDLKNFHIKHFEKFLKVMNSFIVAMSTIDLDHFIQHTVALASAHGYKYYWFV